MNDRTKLEILMGEMAAQADDDSVREEIEGQIADKPWAQEIWRALLQENQQFLKELNDCETPEDLEVRLLRVSEPAAAMPLPAANSRFGIWVWALASVVLIAIGIGFVWQQRSHSRMQTVALLAISNHLNHDGNYGVETQSRRPGELAEELTKLVGFDVHVPNLGDRLRLRGGRKCKLGTHTVAFSLWNDGDANYSLFQFRPDEFGIPRSVRSQLVHTTGPAGEDHPCGAWIWTDQSTGYVLVGDPGRDMENLIPDSR